MYRSSLLVQMYICTPIASWLPWNPRYRSRTASILYLATPDSHIVAAAMSGEQVENAAAEPPLTLAGNPEWRLMRYRNSPTSPKSSGSIITDDEHRTYLCTEKRRERRNILHKIWAGRKRSGKTDLSISWMCRECQGDAVSWESVYVYTERSSKPQCDS